MNCYPLIWAEAIDANGNFLWRARKRNHAPYFQTRPGDEWLISSSPCVLLQRTTSKDGTNKSWMGATRFLCRTLPKVSAEMSLHVLAYNLKRVMKIMGTGKLMEVLQT